VFDNRMHMEFDAGSESLGTCAGCDERTPVFVNCSDETCRTQYLRCEACTAAGRAATCGTCEARVTL
jgi:UPF0176 protein